MGRVASSDAVETFPDVSCIHETDMAILCLVDGEKRWVPKSAIHDDSEVFEKDGEDNLVVHTWWFEKHGWG